MNAKNLFHRNWWAIFYFNFKMLPFRQAIKFPFDFYGKVRFPCLKGKVIINAPIRRCMVEIGRAEAEIFPKQECVISIKGVLVINDSMSNAIGTGVTLEINQNAEMQIGGDIVIAPRTKVIVKKGLEIGNHVRISWEGQIFDSNFHYMRNIYTGEIKNINKAIVIGNYVWIGNRVTLNKGTRIPDHSIVASNSLCNKDYTKEGKEYITIAGNPAKPIAEGYERVFESLEYDLCCKLSQESNN